MEGHDQFYRRAEPFLWKGKTTFMDGQNHFYGRAKPLLWKGRMGLNSDLAIKKSLIPGMAVPQITNNAVHHFVVIYYKCTILLRVRLMNFLFSKLEIKKRE